MTNAADQHWAGVIESAASGDDVAFGRLVAAYNYDMRRVCIVVCRDEALAEDAVQAAWAIAWQKLASIKEPATVKPWLVAIAANKARDLVRKRRRRSEVEVRGSSPSVAGGVDPATGIETLDMLAAIERLDPQDRALLAMRYVAGFDATELSLALGISPAGTRTRSKRLIDRLKGYSVMDDPRAFETQLGRVLQEAAGPSRPTDVATVVREVTTRSPKWRVQPLFSATRFTLAAVTVALFGGFLLVAQPFERVAVTVTGAVTEGLPPVTGPAGNGLIAFARDGHIFVGDPVTGAAREITSSRGWRPLFSPDGTRIAVIREAEHFGGPCAAVVVRAEGSDERVVTPEDHEVSCSQRFAWTPDSRSLVISLYSGDGYLLLDPDGVTDPVPLSPPLPSDVGLPWLSDWRDSASFLRPPDGDRVIVWGGTPALGLMDPDGSDMVDLGDLTGLGAIGYEGFAAPDGSRIASLAKTGDERHLYVMEVDGSDLRRLATTAWPDDWGPLLSWSPDGLTIAVQDARVVESSPESCPNETGGNPCAETTWITLIDVASGEERVLEATHSPGQGNGALVGWSWSPDGRAILLRRQSRPEIIDIENDTLTELPWESEPWAPWLGRQRVAVD